MRKHQVRMKEDEGGKEPVDDSHCWRKYGQKPILGAKYPRLALVTNNLPKDKRVFFLPSELEGW